MVAGNSESHAPDRRQLYHYKIDRLLGRGGTGTVYRALDTKTGQVVALKLFSAAFFRNRMHLRDFARSVTKFTKFEHVNVVRIFDFIAEEEGNCLILEYVDGPDMRWYIENRPWDLQERLIVVAQICNGLQYLHDRGFTHHDLKPANVLFTRKGVAKLTDFSLCGSSTWLALFDAGVHEQVTPLYMAPELIRKEKATNKSDLYSLGVAMYIMFAGKAPFEADNLARLYQCHLHVRPFHPTDVNPRCPRELGDIIMRLLAKEPEARYQDADQLRISLADIGRRRI